MMSVAAADPAALIDGRPADSLPLDDRGLLYGDGLFETMAFSEGRCALWPWHMARLKRGGRQLGIEIPAESTLSRDCAALTAAQSCVIRITITRGSSLRPGYAPTGQELARRIVSRFARPQARAGLRVGICRGRLPSPGSASGLKHMSRLDQVILSREIAGTDWDEGLVFDQHDKLCEGLQSNVLLKSADQDGWLTPPVGAGVAGACRAALLDHELIREQPISRSDLERCTAMGLCNAVRGVEPVIELAGLGTLDPGPAIGLARALRSALEGQDSDAARGGAMSS